MGQLRTTVKDIARHAGVSPATVSLVLRNSPLVADATRARIQSSISQLGYVYDRAAANLRARLTHTIGLIVCEITNPFYAELTAGIDDALDRAGWVAFLANTAESTARARIGSSSACGASRRRLPARSGRGHRRSSSIERLLRQASPSSRCCAGSGAAGRTMSAPISAWHDAGRRTPHPARSPAHRLRRRGPAVSPARDRARRLSRDAGALRPAARARSSIAPRRARKVPAPSTKLIRGRPDDPTAILCHNDVCAFGVHARPFRSRHHRRQRLCRHRLRQHPEAAHHRPTLTTIEIDARQIGEEAARLLVRRIKTPDAPPESIVIPPRLIVRSSCGGRRAGWTSTSPAATSLTRNAGSSREERRMTRTYSNKLIVVERRSLRRAVSAAHDRRAVRRSRRRGLRRQGGGRAYAGPQTKWEGPTAAPKPDKGKKVVFLSGDEQNDISHLYGVYIKEAGEKLGWDVTIIDGKGSPTSWLAGMNQAIALKPDGIALFADAASLQDPIKAGVAQGIKFVGLHAAGLPGPQPDLNLFVNIQEDPREIGKAEADWAIADSNGTAQVVILSHNEYAIAEVKSMATKAEIEKCPGCKVLDYVNSPASEAAQRQPQLTTSWVQRFGLPLYATSVGDNDWDFAVPVLRSGGVDPAQAKLIAADGNRSAYDRIRKGDQYQVVTVSEPIELQA